MSTRGNYIFKNKEDSFVVYVHSDNYPTGAAKNLLASRAIAWAGDRFEPDEAAAAFVCAAKALCVASRKEGAKRIKDKNPDFGGNVRLAHGKDFDGCSVDVEFIYVVTAPKGVWTVAVHSALSPFWDEPAEKHTEVLWTGPLSELTAWAEKRG